MLGGAFGRTGFAAFADEEEAVCTYGQLTYYAPYAH